MLLDIFLVFHFLYAALFRYVFSHILTVGHYRYHSVVVVYCRVSSHFSFFRSSIASCYKPFLEPCLLYTTDMAVTYLSCYWPFLSLHVPFTIHTTKHGTGLSVFSVTLQHIPVSSFFSFPCYDGCLSMLSRYNSIIVSFLLPSASVPGPRFFRGAFLLLSRFDYGFFLV